MTLTRRELDRYLVPGTRGEPEGCAKYAVRTTDLGSRGLVVSRSSVSAAEYGKRQFTSMIHYSSHPPV